MAEDDAYKDFTGKILGGKWVVNAFLGTGYYSPVFRAHDVNLPNRVCAIKILAANLADRKFMKQLRERNNEVIALRELPYDAFTHIVEPYEVDVVKGTGTGFDGGPYIAMEYMNRGSLAKIWKEMTEQGEIMSLEEKLGWMDQALIGLDEAHKHRILNLDFQLGNLLLNSKGILKLSDFGVGALMDATGYYYQKTRLPVKYQAPEQRIEGAKLTPKTDVYGIGGTLLEFIAGLNFYDFDARTDLENGYGDLPEDLRNLIIQCLAKNPEGRPPVKEVRERLAGVRGVWLVPEISSIIYETMQEMNLIIGNRNQHSYNTLSKGDVNGLYKAQKSCYKELKKREFETPVGDIESLIHQTLETDVLTMGLFASPFDEDRKNPKIATKQDEELSDIYDDILDVWEKKTDRWVMYDTTTWEFSSLK